MNNYLIQGLMGLGLLVPGGLPVGPGLVAALPSSAPPRLAIDPPGRIDLGDLGPREVREQRYTLHNRSLRPIVLKVLDLAPGVRVSGPALDGPIAGGASAALFLRVDPEGWVGPQHRNARLGTDDPGQGYYYLPVRMTVRPDLTVDGARRSFGAVAPHESPSQIFTFVRESGAPLRLRVVSGLPPYLECELRPEGARAELEAILRPERIPPGMRLGLERIGVESNAPLQPRFDLYLEWRLCPPIETEPARLVFPAPLPDVQDLRLRARDGRPFRILEARLEGAGFTVEAPREPAPEQRVRVRRRTAEPARAMLVLRCSGEAEPVRVPVAYLPAGD